MQFGTVMQIGPPKPIIYVCKPTDKRSVALPSAKSRQRQFSWKKTEKISDKKVRTVQNKMYVARQLQIAPNQLHLQL